MRTRRINKGERKRKRERVSRRQGEMRRSRVEVEWVSEQRRTIQMPRRVRRRIENAQQILDMDESGKSNSSKLPAQYVNEGEG